MIWDYYRHHAVRDLAWSVFSPPLMAALPALADVVIDEQIATQQDIDWFNQLDFAPAELLTHIAERQSRRLGIYFENLLAYYFQNHRRLRLKTQNLQVTSQGRTLGAFDFLLYDEQAAQSLHLETAVKFYLGIPDFPPSPQMPTARDGGSAASAGAAQLPTARDGGSAASAGAAQLPTASAWHQWIGPNSRDRLDIKLQHLQYRQLRLAEQSPSRAALAALGIDPHRLQRRLLMRGILFYPAHASLPAPVHAHPDHLRGTWYYLADFLQEDHGPGAWTLLPRLQWLAEPPAAGHLDRAALVRYLREHFERESAPVMFSRRVQKENYVETRREIIVPDYWPRTT